MYETHFGLKKRPFRALAAGSDVFVGPQTAATIAGLKKGLAAQDAVVVVSGPIGVGKTTLVRRAIDALGQDPLVLTVGRMQLGHDEVLELLLEELGAKMPAGTVQRFTAFRRALKERAEQGSRVIIVVEDATRIGVDALAELEALTAADAGVSEGANVVLMGDEALPDIMQAPRLARLNQRVRLRQPIQPFGPGELTAYLKHCFRLAGQEFDAVFAPGAADVLHTLTGGVARMANNLVESALTAACDAKETQVGIDLVKRVAKNEYGLDVSEIEAAPDHHLRERRQDDRRVTDRRAHSPVAEETSAPEPDAPAAVAAAPSVPAGLETADDGDAEIPELIQDTLPDLAVLAPALANQVPADEPPAPDIPTLDETPEAPAEAIPTLSDTRDIETTTPEPEPAAAAAPEPAPAATPPPEPAPVAAQSPEPTPAATTAAEIAAAAEPELDPAIEAALEAAQVGHAEEEVPAWERDPTLAELRPDLDALEHAMAVAQGLVPPSEDEEVAPAAAPEPAEPVPEITLDREIQAKIDEATEILKQAEEQEQAEPEEAAESEKPVSEILAEAKEKEEDESEADSQSIESQLDATDAFAVKQIIPEEAEAAAGTPEEPELPVLDVPTMPDIEATEVPAAAAPPAEEPLPSLDLAAEISAAPAEANAEVPATPVEPAAEEVMAKTEPAPAEAEPELKVGLQEPDTQMRKIAAGLSRAKTLDDVDDKMAETLFGEEFSLMAAEIAANGAPELSANDDFELSLEDSQALAAAEIAGAAPIDAIPEPEPQPVPQAQATPATPPAPAPTSQATPSAQPKPAPTPPPTLQGGNPDLGSTQQRLATVRALNAGQANVTPGPESIILSDPNEPAPAAAAEDHPETIEEQINTSITQTLKALSVHPPAPDDDEDEEEKDRKGGFFSRFKRS